VSRRAHGAESPGINGGKYVVGRNNVRHEFSLERVRREYVAGTSNPLEFLYAWEARSAELYVRALNEPAVAYGVGRVRFPEFAKLWHDTFKFSLSRRVLDRLQLNPAWQDYVKRLQTEVRASVMDILKRQALDVVDDYEWSRKAARAAGDYKENRLATSDALDRIGASEAAPKNAVTVQTIVLRGRNYSADDLLAESPELVGEVVEEPPQLTDGSATLQRDDGRVWSSATS
jgi:hypothetical protein